MRDSKISGSEISVSSSAIFEEAQKRTLELRDLLAIENQGDDDSFPRQLCESLQVDSEVVKVMMVLEEMAALRKRASIMKALDESKSRIVTALEQCDEDENIPWGANDDPASMIMEARKSQHSLPFVLPGKQQLTDEMKRKKEQMEFMFNIEKYIKSCKSKAIDLQELMEWMSNFSFEVTWDDVGIKPVMTRETEETDSHRGMVVALQHAWQCARKMKLLIEILTTDDKYDVISGKLPPHIAAARRKKKGAVEGKLWCSHKLRKMLDEYERMRLEMNDKKQESEKPTMSQKQVTVQAPGEEAQPPNNPYKEIESVVLKEVSRSWKEATADVMYFMREARIHRFTKKSCQQRLSRATLLLEFVCAAIEGKMIDSARTERQLEDTKNHVTRLQDEISTLNIKLAEANKATTTAQRKIQKLKRQLEMINKQNQKLQAKLVEFKDEIAEKKRQIAELQEMPNQAEFEEKLAKIEELENELAKAEEEITEMRTSLEQRNNECNAIKMRFAKEQEMNASMSEDIQVLEEENAKAETKLLEMGKKLSEQESNVMSLRLMVFYKDEVIRRLKQAAIELKSSEKTRKAPKKPPPSPEEQAPRKSEYALKKESSGKLKKEEVKIPPDPEPEQEPELEPEPALQQIDQDKTKTTKVIVVTQDYKKLQRRHEDTLREMDETKRELGDVRKEFDFKLKQGLQSEKQKGILESMKMEEDVQHLCFSVQDETMRVQKEMKNFIGNLGSELGSLLGIKGELLKFDTGNTNRRSGVCTTVNIGFDNTTGPGPSFGNKGAIGGMSGPRMMFDNNMMGFPPQGGMGGFDFGMGGQMNGGQMNGGQMMGGQMVGGQMMGGQMMGAEMMGMPIALGGRDDDEGATKDGADTAKPNINYWKNLKSAVGGTPVDKEVKAKENQGIAEVAELLSQRRQAREQRKRELEETRKDSNMSVATTDSQASQMAEDIIMPSPTAGLLPSEEESKGSECVSDSSKIEMDELPCTSKSADAKEKMSKKDAQSEKPAHKDEYDRKPLLLPVSQVNIASQSEEKSGQVKFVISQVHQKVKIQKSETEQTTSMARIILPEDSTTQSKGNLKGVAFNLPQDHRRESCRPAETHNILMERKRAMFGERRRSSVVPFHPRRMSVDVRRHSIFPRPPPKEPAKITGFFGLRSAYSLTERPRPPTPVKQEPKLPKEPEPLNQAEVYVRAISKQMREFFENLNAKLVEVIRKNKQDHETKTLEMENKMLQEKIKYKAEIDTVCQERDRRSKELNNAKQILMDLGFGVGSSSKLDFKSSLPVDLIKRLKEAEGELDEAKERLDKAAFHHDKHANEYMNMSCNLDNQLKQGEINNKKLQRKLKEEVKAKNELKVQLYNTHIQQKQKLFLSLKNLKRNYVTVEKNMEIGDNMKKVALSLLRRSMLYPTMCLTSLVQYYCQHVKFTQCQERVRKLITEKTSNHETCTLGPKPPSRQKQILTTLLAGVTMKRELAKQRWEKRKNVLEIERQKLFLKLALVLNRIQKDQRSLEIYQPIILQVSGKGVERSHHNTPINASLVDLRILLPKNEFEFSRFPKIPSATDPQTRRDLALEGSQPPRDMRRMKGAVPHWFPDDSLSCPFAVRSGHIAPVNSHISIVSSKMHSNYPVETPARQFRSRNRRIEIPRIMEMEIQSGLRSAKRVVMKRLGGERFSSTSMYSTTSSVSLGLSNNIQNGASFSVRYNKQFHQQDDLHYDKFGEQDHAADINSMQDLFSCPLPPIPTPPGRKEKTPSQSGMMPSGIDCLNDYSRNLSTSPSMRSSTQTTPGLPPLPANSLTDNTQVE